MNWISIVGVCCLILGTVLSYVGTNKSSKQSQEKLTNAIQEKNTAIDDIRSTNIKLIDQNTNLLESTNDVTLTNKDLLLQNTEMLDKITKYQTDIEQKDQRIIELEKLLPRKLNPNQEKIFLSYMSENPISLEVIPNTFDDNEILNISKQLIRILLDAGCNVTYNFNMKTNCIHLTEQPEFSIYYSKKNFIEALVLQSGLSKIGYESGLIETKNVKVIGIRLYINSQES